MLVLLSIHISAVDKVETLVLSGFDQFKGEQMDVVGEIEMNGQDQDPGQDFSVLQLYLGSCIIG